MKETICVKCGKAVTATDLREMVGATVEEKNRWLADCGTGSSHGWAFGATEVEAVENYNRSQAWGLERLERLSSILDVT